MGIIYFVEFWRETCIYSKPRQMIFIGSDSINGYDFSVLFRVEDPMVQINIPF